MLELKKVIETFPSARIAPNVTSAGGLPVEISLIAQLGHGSGNHLFASVLARQKAHEEFIDELDEPSTKLGGTDFSEGDATSLYSFVVGAKGHPFHRHAGHRINKLGGDLSEELKNKIRANETTIPSLTELLPETVIRLLQTAPLKNAQVPTIALSIDAPPGTLQRAVCDTTRGSVGVVLGALGKGVAPPTMLSRAVEHVRPNQFGGR